jgi:hypothetical protein
MNRINRNIGASRSAEPFDLEEFETLIIKSPYNSKLQVACHETKYNKISGIL